LKQEALKESDQIRPMLPFVMLEIQKLTL